MKEYSEILQFIDCQVKKDQFKDLFNVSFVMQMPEVMTTNVTQRLLNRIYTVSTILWKIQVCLKLYDIVNRLSRESKLSNYIKCCVVRIKQLYKHYSRLIVLNQIINHCVSAYEENIQMMLKDMDNRSDFEQVDELLVECTNGLLTQTFVTAKPDEFDSEKKEIVDGYVEWIDFFHNVCNKLYMLMLYCKQVENSPEFEGTFKKMIERVDQDIDDMNSNLVKFVTAVNKSTTFSKQISGDFFVLEKQEAEEEDEEDLIISSDDL